MKKIIELGKIDWNHSGRRNCMVTVELNLDDTDRGPVFRASAKIWNPSHSDCYYSGQCFDEIEEHFDAIDADMVMSYFPNYPLFEEIYDLHAKFHCNDSHAGDKEQEAEIKRWLEEEHYDYDYELVCEHLKAYDLYEHNGYTYGHGWCYEEIPEADLERIKKLFFFCGRIKKLVI